jgi:TIR domain/MAP3K TRAFs-binding domain
MGDVALQDWLKYAPDPPPLAAGKTYHVFISYRSVNRRWVLQLYDILRGLKYSAFLDQYVLAAAAPLATSLSDALAGSQSAIMIWSSSYEDSEWCKKEFNTLEAKEAASRGTFRYVIARVDDTQLPDLVIGKIFLDFSDDRDGPNGSALLRLLYGIHGIPLPPEAVVLAATVDEQQRAARIKIKAARLNGDSRRLVELAKSQELAWLTSPILGCEVAEGLISLGKNPEALDVLDALKVRCPYALRAKQLYGLALARNKQFDAARETLGELYAAGEIDAETLGLYARTWMDKYEQSGQRLHLMKARDLYRQAFEASNESYAGINAASKSLLLGERETAMQLAARVEVNLTARPAPTEYWRIATLAELRLLQGDFAAAAQGFIDAVLSAPEEHGSHTSTRAQASRLLQAMSATESVKAQVLVAFDHDGCRS